MHWFWLTIISFPWSRNLVTCFSQLSSDKALSTACCEILGAISSLVLMTLSRLSQLGRLLIRGCCTGGRHASQYFSKLTNRLRTPCWLVWILHSHTSVGSRIKSLPIEDNSLGFGTTYICVPYVVHIIQVVVTKNRMVTSCAGWDQSLAVSSCSP